MNALHKKKIRVKMICNGDAGHWLRQLPDANPLLGNCEFIFNLEEQHYDWAVVYDDLAPAQGERRSLRAEELKCHPQNTLLITVEPLNIKSYGTAFTKQFGWVLTSQPDWALPHSGRIYSQPALIWFYGAGSRISFQQMEQHLPLEKSELISTVCSNKQQKHTVHNQRYEFTHALKERMPELTIFGRGIRPIIDKSEAVDAFKYHIAIENFIGEHHWTEKLADAFLGCTLPFYYGCPNAATYFPTESFIPIDINNTERAEQTIKHAIENGEYEKRLPAILEARKRVLEQYNLFAVLNREISQRHTASTTYSPVVLQSRRALRSKPLVLISDLLEKARLRLRSRRKS